MTEIIVPQPKEDKNGNLEIFPTLGPQICDFLEERFVYGPGPLRGQPYVVRDDFRYILYRAYEHFPDGHVEDYDGEKVDYSGRRHFNKVTVSLPKGSAKCVAPETELTLESGERIKAKDIKVGDSIQSYLDGKVVYRRVAAVEEQPLAETFRVVSSNGREIEVSEGHPFLSSGNWVNVEDLKAGDKLVAVEKGEVKDDKVQSIEKIGKTHTIAIEVEDTHVHVTNGLVTHNTELMALVACLELHPDAPIRFNGYDPDAPGGMAPGRSVVSPYVPLLAPTKDQLDDLAYGAAMTIIQDIEDADLFDVTRERIQVQGEAESRILPVAASAGRLDGLKPTFQCIDESHRMFDDRHHKAVQTMENNLTKRMVDDPWQLVTTTAGDPNEPSVAKAAYDYGMKIFKGKAKDPRTFFYHRQTSDENAKFDTMGNRIRALKEASGEEASKFRDLVSVAAKWDEGGVDTAYLERVWCNRWVQSSQTAFNAHKFEALGHPSLVIEPGSLVTLGFDGAQTDDSTGLVMTDVKTGVQNLVGLWERPEGVKKWRVPVSEVNATVEMIFEDFEVLMFYADPPYWQEAISTWEGRWEKRVIEWPTRNTNNMYYAIRSYNEAIEQGELSHDGNPDLVRHVANAGRNNLNVTDDEGLYKYRLAKITKDRKFDACMAAILSWQAMLDAKAKGLTIVEEKQAPRRIR